MKLYNLKDHNEQVSFAQAVTRGLGKNQGGCFPHDLPEFSLTEIDEMLKLDFVTRSANPLGVCGDEILKSGRARARGVCLPGSGRQC